MDVAYAIGVLVPAAMYGGVPGETEKEYDALRWEDKRPKPAWEEIVKVGDPPPNPVFYDPDKLVLAVDALGKVEELEAMLAAAPARVRLRWQKAATFNGDDPDFKATIAGIQEAWKLTDEQRDELLKQCEVPK